MGIKCGVGYSSLALPTAAAVEALENMNRGLAGQKPDLIIGFSSVKYDQDKLVASIAEFHKGIPFIGCSDAGEIMTTGTLKQSLVLMGMVSEKIKFTVGRGDHIEIDARKAGQDLALNIKEKDPKISLLIMLADGLAGNGADIVRGVQKVLGDKFPVVGGAAGDDFLFKKTFEYYNGEVINNSVVGVGLSGDFTFGIGVRHGWTPISAPMKVTKSHGNVLCELDSKPAVSIYEDYFGEKKAKKLREEPLARMAITYPLGMLVKGSDEYLIRDPMTVDEKGALTCAAEIPVGSTIRLMIGSKEDAFKAARLAAEQAKEQMQGRSIDAAIVFNCIARDKLFGKDAQKEIDTIREILGEKVPLIGFYTYGEQAPVAGKVRVCSPVFHNETVVILTLGEA